MFHFFASMFPKSLGFLPVLQHLPDLRKLGEIWNYFLGKIKNCFFPDFGHTLFIHTILFTRSCLTLIASIFENLDQFVDFFPTFEEMME